jgi:uncharacterized membrane protein YbhN (UPF0104 family)
VAIVWATGHVRAFKPRDAQGFAVMRDFRRYARRVLAWQLLDWTCRLIGAYWFLRAFNVDADLRNALVSQSAQSLATALPISPGGIGTEQALLVVVLAGEAARSSLVSLSVGMKLSLMVWNLALGFTALALMARTLSWREIRQRRETGEAEEQAAREESAPAGTGTAEPTSEHPSGRSSR